MIDLGHEKESLGVISVTHVTESSRADVALRVAPDAYSQARGADGKVRPVRGEQELGVLG